MSKQPRLRLGYYEGMTWSAWDDYVAAGNGHGPLDRTWVWTDTYLPENYGDFNVSKTEVPPGIVWAITRDTEQSHPPPRPGN